MATKNFLKLFNGFRDKSTPGSISASPPPVPTPLPLPSLVLAPDMAFIAAKGQATHKGDLSHVQGEREVKEHHESLAASHLEKISDTPKGLQLAKTKELSHVRNDLNGVDAELGRITKRTEIDVASDKPRSLAELAKLFTTGGVAVTLSMWSVYSTHAFLNGTGILSGWPAWGVSLGPIMMAFAVKEALTIIEGDRPRRLAKLSFIALTAVTAIVWIATFGHEAGSPLNQLNDVSAATSSGASNNSTFVLVRGVAQLVIELFGGGILFHTFFALWEKKSDGQEVSKVVHESPQYLAAEAERSTLRVREHELEIHLAQIAKWFESHAPFKAQYVTRANGQFTNVLNVLQGAQS